MFFEDNVKEIFYLFELNVIQVDKEFIDERLQNKSTMSILTPGKKTRLNKERKTVTREIFYLFRTISIVNTIPGSNISMKEIIGNYQCFSLARSLFDTCGLLNYGGDRKSDLVYVVIKCIDDVWIDLWQGKLDAVVIDAMKALSTLLNQPSSKAFKWFHVIFKSHCSRNFNIIHSNHFIRWLL